MLAVCFLLAGLTARASSQTGSISLQLPPEANGAEFTLIRVADFQADGTFAYTADFAGSTVSLTDIGDAQAAQNVAEQFWLMAQDAGVAGTVYRAESDGLTIWDLQPGYYLLVQTSGQAKAEVQKVLAPVPYMPSGTSDLVYDVDLTPKYEIPAGAAILTKDDGEGVPVAGAQFDLERKVYIVEDGPAAISMETGLDAGGRFAWDVVQRNLVTNEVGQLSMENLPLGMYRLIETAAPAGYFLDSTPVYFEIKAEGLVQARGASFTAVEGTVEQLTVVNRPTRTLVDKVNEKGESLPGAYFVVKNADGTGVVDENGQPRFWISTTGEGPITLKGLPPGDYLLCEVFSPAGYKVAPDVPFTVSPDIDAVNTVSMVDEEEKPTQDTLHITKRLVDVEGDTLSPIEDTFYVALFSDEERTVRVSDVKALHFVGASSTTAVFENLEPNTTYYVGETDPFGTVTFIGDSNGTAYEPTYPDGYEVRLTNTKLDDTVVIENVFYGIPDGYYVAGELTVTKKTLLNGGDYPRKGKFYAGIFLDPALTQLIDENGVLELPMGGGSTASVTREVAIGQTIGSSTTYYVAETDKNGVPLNPDEVTEYVITVEAGGSGAAGAGGSGNGSAGGSGSSGAGNGSGAAGAGGSGNGSGAAGTGGSGTGNGGNLAAVTVSTDVPAAEVTITNDFIEEQTEIETEETEIETSTYYENNSTGSSSGSTPTGTSTAPQTGDDTPIGLYVGLLVAALAVIVVLVVVRKRKKK